MPAPAIEIVREDATVMDHVASSLDELRQKIVCLSSQLEEVEGQKKSANKGFNDAIKDIKEEIKMTLVLIKEQESANGQ